MRIRQRMLIVELSTATAFIIAITLFLILLQNIISFKNLEIETQKVLNKLNNINYRTTMLINSRTNFSEMSYLWHSSVSTYTRHLDELNSNSDTRLLGTKLTKDITLLTNRWEELKMELLNDFDKEAMEVTQKNLKMKVGDYTFNYVRTYEGLPQLLTDSEIEVLDNFLDDQRAVARELISYTTIMKTLIYGISQEIEKRITFTLYLILGLLVLIITAAMVTAFLYARGLSRQIKQVHNTATLVTSGNFNVKLDIRTSDEFRSLSNNFNSFTNMLWSRLDAVRTIMKDMAEISGDMEDIKTVEREILNLAVEHSQADAGAIFLYDEEENILRPAFVKGDFPPPYPVSASITQNPDKAFDHFRTTDIKLGEHIIGKVASSGKAVFIKNGDQSQDLPQRWSNDPLHISSFMSIPLLVSNNVLGVFALAKREPYVYFTDLSFTNMKTFGEYTALSIDNRYKYLELKEKFELSRELSIASEIQQGLRLEKIPRFKNLQISSFHKTAKGISGDYYDIFRISETKTAVIVCDVAGKGIPAALVMVMIRTILRVIANPNSDAGTMLTMLNNTISGKVGTDQYATMGLMIVDTKTGELTFSNAADLPLNIYRQENKRFSSFNTEGLPIGVEKDTVYAQQTIKLTPGDIAAICTDGLTEARNIHGNEFSQTTLLKEIKKHSEKEANEITEIIGNEMDIFMRGSFLYDDQSLLILKYKGE